MTEGHHFELYVETLTFWRSAITSLLKMHTFDIINMSRLPRLLFPNLKFHASWEKYSSHK